MVKMYCMVLYSLSPMQKWIQSLHAVAEYMSEFGQEEETIDWVKNHKTVIVLDGWTSQKMDEINNLLDRIAWLRYAYFEEEDLWGQLTALCFLVDDSDDLLKYFINNFKLAS